MEELIKIIGIGLVALVIAIILKQYKPEYAIYVSIIAGAIILGMSMEKLNEIIELLTSLSQKAGTNSYFILLLIKITGIAILTEFAVSICKDAGETAIASKIDFGGKIIIIRNIYSNYK